MTHNTNPEFLSISILTQVSDRTLTKKNLVRPKLLPLQSGGHLSPCSGQHDSLVSGPHRQYGWDFPERIPEKFRKDSGNALREFPGIPLESTAGIPPAL